MNVHELDIYPQYFEPVNQKLKTFEIRRDQGFKIGDLLVLWEFNPETETHTGRRVFRKITYITDYAQQPPYVVLGIEENRR